jgi:hypothetical protein
MNEYWMTLYSTYILLRLCLFRFQQHITNLLPTIAYTLLQPSFFFSFLVWVESTSATNWPIVPAQDNIWWWMWSSWWNENWQGKQKYSEKTCPSAICSPQIPHDLNWAWTRTAAVGSRQLTTWAMERPPFPNLLEGFPVLTSPCFLV